MFTFPIIIEMDIRTYCFLPLGWTKLKWILSLVIKGYKGMKILFSVGRVWGGNLDIAVKILNAYVFWPTSSSFSNISYPYIHRTTQRYMYKYAVFLTTLIVIEKYILPVGYWLNSVLKQILIIFSNNWNLILMA